MQLKELASQAKQLASVLNVSAPPPQSPYCPHGIEARTPGLGAEITPQLV